MKWIQNLEISTGSKSSKSLKSNWVSQVVYTVRVGKKFSSSTNIYWTPMYARQFPSQFSQSNLRVLQVTMTFNLRNIIPIGVWIQQIVLPHPVGEVYFPVSLMVRCAMDLIWLKGVVSHDPSKGMKCISALETALMCFCHFCEKMWFWQLRRMGDILNLLLLLLTAIICYLTH